MNTITSITNNSFNSKSWRSCLRLLLALVLLGCGAAAKAQNSDVWTNGAGTMSWSATNNWIVNGDPTLGLSTNGGDNLTFPIMGGPNATYRSTNDFTAGAVAIGSMTFTTNGYFVGGNALVISNGITDNYGSNFITTPLTLGASQTFQNTVNPAGQTNTQTTLGTTVNLGNNNNTLTIAGGGNFFLNGTGVSGALMTSGTNGGGMLLVNNSGGIARLGPSAGSTGNSFGSNTVVTVNLTTNFNYGTNTFNLTNVVIFATNNGAAGGTNLVFIPVTNSANAFGSGYSYVSSNTVYTYQTNSHYLVQDVVRVDAGTLQQGSTAAQTIPTGASVGNVSLDGTLDLNGYSLTINGLEDQGSPYGKVDNVGTTLTGVYTLTVGNASSNGIFNGVIQNSSGTVAFTKTGYGTEVLMNGNQYSGQTTINQGVLMLSNSVPNSTVGSLGAGSTTLSIASGAVFDISALNAYGGYIPSGGLTVNAGTPTKPYTNFYGSYFPYSPATPGFVVSISSTNTVVTSVISNSYNNLGVFQSSVTNFTTNYTTIVYSTNSIVNVINYDVVGDFSVNGGGAISPITSISPGIATWSINGDLSIDSSRTLPTVTPNRVNFLLNNTTTAGGGTNDLIAVTGKLFIGDQLDVAITPKTGTLVSGGGQKYTLFTASGGYTATGNGLVNGGDYNGATINPIAPRGITATITSDAHNVYLEASGTAAPGSLIWRGTASARNWDIKLSQNWVLNPGLTPDYYYSGDNVVFDDMGVSNVILPIVEAPGSVTFNNNRSNYVFAANAGTFITGNGGLTLNGSGSVTFNNPNSFTGDITINNGTLIGGNYGGYDNRLFYNGVAPGKIIFGGLGNNEIFLHNWSIADTSQGGFISGFTLNSGANAQIGTLGGRASNVTQFLVVGDQITRNIGSSIYFTYGIRSGSVSTIYFTNTIPWTYGLMFPGYGHTGTDWVQGQTNYPTGALASYNYAGYSNNMPAAAWGAINNLTNNMSENAATLALANSAAINTLRLVGPSSITIPTGGALTNITGGVLVSSGSAVGGSVIQGGSIIGPAGGDLIILQNYLASPLYIGSVIANNPAGTTALTLGGLGGTVIITNTATYSGATYLNNGTLQVGAGTPLGSIASSSAIYDNGTLSFNRPDATSVAAVSGSGNLTQAGTGSLTLTANNTLSGLVTISSGILQLGNGGAAGSVSNAVGLADNGMLVINNNNVSGYPNVISGSGQLVNAGTGVFVIATNETYSGNTVVSNGTIKLMPTGTISNTAAIIVNSGAVLNIDPGTLTLRSAVPSEKLAGSGSIMGSVATAAGTTLTPGTNGVVGTLSISNNLNLNGGVYAFDVGTNATDKILCSTLSQNGGTVVFNPSGPLTNGVYNLIRATNGLSGSYGNIPVAGSLPLGQLAVLTNATPNTLDLLVYGGFAPVIYWHGDGTQNYWNATANSFWKDGSGNPILYVSADIVNFDNTGSNNIPVSLNASSVYPGNVTVNSTINYTIGDGVYPADVISGGASLTKDGSSTLTLQSVNNYLGVTVIKAGVVQLNGAGTSASADGMVGSGAVTNNGTLIANNATNETLAGGMVGSGLLVQQGVGTLILAGDNTGFTGPVSVTNILQVGNGASGTLGTGNVTNNGALVFNNPNTLNVPGNISGSGAITNLGTGTVQLNGSNTFAGNLAIPAGKIQLVSAYALPGNVPLYMDDNGGGVAAGALDMNGHDVNTLSLQGANTGIGTATFVAGQIFNNGATTNTLIIGGGGTYTIYDQVVDHNNGGTGGVALLVTNNTFLNLYPGYNVASGGAASSAFASTFSGGMVISNSTVHLGNGGQGNDLLNGQHAAGLGTITLCGGLGTITNGNTGVPTNGIILGAQYGSSLNSARGEYNTYPTIYVPAGQFGSIFMDGYGGLTFPLTGSGTLTIQPNYVRGQIGGNWTAFTGTIVLQSYSFATYGTVSGGFTLTGTGTDGPTNGTIYMHTNNLATVAISGGTDNAVYRIGALAGGDNTSELGGRAHGNGTANGNRATIWAIGDANITTTNGSRFVDVDCHLRKVGTASLTLTNAVMSYGGQTVVSNGALIFAPLTNNMTALALGTTFLVTSNYTIVNPGILDVSQAGGTLYLVSSVRAQTLYGNGELNGNLIVTNSVVAPGRRANTAGLFPGSLKVDGTALFGTNSTIQMSVSTNTPVGYDNLNVVGSLTIQQASLVVVTNGAIPFPPMSTNVFRFFSNSVNVALGGFSGGITNISVQTNLPPGMFWRTNLNGSLAGYPTIPAGSMAIINTNNPTSVLLLQGLVVTPAGVLAPAFTSNTFSYTAVESYLHGSVTVTPTDYDTTVSNRVIYLGATNGVVSGAPSTSMNLDANPNKNNVVVVMVTGQDGVSVTNYTVTVIRHPDLTPGLLAPVVNNNVMKMDWPLSENGYQLQAQTNALGIGLSNNWTVVAGSTLTNKITILIDSNQPSVFYRLINTNSP